jgi:hypothetical protein
MTEALSQRIEFDFFGGASGWLMSSEPPARTGLFVAHLTPSSG